MGRRDPDPRPPVDLWGPDRPPAEATTTITVGGRRSRRAPVLAVVAAVAILAGGLALGDEDDEGAGSPPGEERDEPDDRHRDDVKPPNRETTSTTRRPTTTTTSTTYVEGPVLPVQTGAAVLLSDSSSTWTWLDLDTGRRVEVEVGVSDPYGMTAVSGGVVSLAGDEAEYRPLPLGIPIVLGRADAIVPSGSPDTVWLLRTIYDGPTMTGTEAVLVDLQGNERSGLVSLPAAYPVGGTEEALVFSRGGRTYTADESGIRALAPGNALRTNRTSVVVFSCDDQAVCAPDVVDIATGSSRRLPAMPDPYEMGINVMLADDGSLAIVSYRDAGQSLQLFDPAGREIGTVTDLSAPGEPRWLPGGLGLVAPASGGGGVVRISFVEDGGGILVEPIAAFDGHYGEFLYVIPR